MKGMRAQQIRGPLEAHHGLSCLPAEDPRLVGLALLGDDPSQGIIDLANLPHAGVQGLLYSESHLGERLGLG